MLRPLKDKIAFVFLDKFDGRHFIEENPSETIFVPELKSNDASSNTPRWARVLAVGPTVEHPDIKPGAIILVDPLRWTEGFKHDGIRVWFTKEAEVSAIRYDDNSDKVTFENE